MLVTSLLSFALVACTTAADPDAAADPPTDAEAFPGGPPVAAERRTTPQGQGDRDSVVFTKIMHRQYEGRALFVDDEHRGTLPVDAILEVGPHRIEILVGPADRLAFEVDLQPHPGVFVLQLGNP